MCILAKALLIFSEDNTLERTNESFESVVVKTKKKITGLPVSVQKD